MAVDHFRFAEKEAQNGGNRKSSGRGKSRLLVSGTLHLAAGGVHVFSTSARLEGLKTKEKASLEHVLESNEIIPKELLASVEDVSFLGVISI